MLSDTGTISVRKRNENTWTALSWRLILQDLLTSHTCFHFLNSRDILIEPILLTHHHMMGLSYFHAILINHFHHLWFKSVS